MWLTLHTNPRKEYTVQGNLLDLGLNVYLPEEPNKIQRRDRPSHRPFFPHYLFVRKPSEPDLIERIQWTPGLRRIVSFGGRPALISDEFIESIRHRLETTSLVELNPMKKGDTVLITRGPFKGIEAIFDRALSSHDRVRVLLDIIGNAQVTIDTHVSDLERIA